MLLIALTVALFYFDEIFTLIEGPYLDAQKALPDDVSSQATVQGAGGPLMLHLKLCGLAAVVVTSPSWPYQIWAFIFPGLNSHDRKLSRVFGPFAGPLFLPGARRGLLKLGKDGC